MAFPAADIDVLGNGQLIMRMMKPGNVSEPMPVTGDIAEVRVQAILVEDQQYPCRPEYRRFRLGDGDECDAFELVSQRMRPNEVVALRSRPAAFGLDKELCSQKPVAEVKAVIQLLRVSKETPVAEQPILKRLEESKRKKVRGSMLLAREEFQAAGYSFQLGLSYIAQACHTQVANNFPERFGARVPAGARKGEAEEVSFETLNLCVSLYTNLATVHLRLNNHKDGVAACEAALSLDPSNVKALNVRAQAVLATAELSDTAQKDAIKTLERVLEEDPQNEQAKDMLESARERPTLRSWRSWAKFIVGNILVLAVMPSMYRMVKGDMNSIMYWATGDLQFGPPGSNATEVSIEKGMLMDDL